MFVFFWDQVSRHWAIDVRRFETTQLCHVHGSTLDETITLLRNVSYQSPSDERHIPEE
jgi:hypothetical protein